MNLNNQILMYIENNTKNIPKKSKELYNNCLLDSNNRGNLSLTQYLSVGEILKPIHEFKVYIGKTLHSMDKKDILVVYRIISKYKDHIHPVFHNDGIPKLVLLYYKDAKIKDINSTENLTHVIITETMSQLTMITCSCATLGRMQLE